MSANADHRHKQRSDTLVIPYAYEVRQRPLPPNLHRPLGSLVGFSPEGDTGRPTGLRAENGGKDDGLP